MTNLTPERREELGEKIRLGYHYGDRVGIPVPDARTLLAASELLDAALAENMHLRREIEVWNQVAILPVPPTRSVDDVTRMNLRKLAAAQINSAEARDKTNTTASRLGWEMEGR